MVRGIANSKIGFGDLILLLRYFFKLKVSTHPNVEYKKTALRMRFFSLKNNYLNWIEPFAFTVILDSPAAIS